MLKDLFVRNIERKGFGKIEEVVSIPNLIEIQKTSYENFLQMNVPVDKRTNTGLQGVFNSVFPISDYESTCTLEFVSYRIEKSKYDVEESRQRGINYVAPLRILLRLVLWDSDPDTGAREVSGIKEQEVYVGDIPLMTKNATFIINGVERVVVSQMHRSPGVFFDHDKGKTHSSGKYLYSARVIPYRGSWLDFEFDTKDLLHFRIDRKRKMLVSTLLRALSMDDEEIYSTFYKTRKLTRIKDGWSAEFVFDDNSSVRLDRDIIDAKTGKVVAEAGSRLNKRMFKQLQDKGVTHILYKLEDLVGQYVGMNIAGDGKKKPILVIGEEITEEAVKILDKANINEISIINIGENKVSSCIRNTVVADKVKSENAAVVDIFRVLRPGEPTTAEASKAMFRTIFFDENKYSLSEVGRVKLNARLDLEIPETVTVLTKEDIIAIIRTVVDLKEGIGEIDDIDNLGNRRIRSVGELLENQFRLGLIRVERAVLEKLSSSEIENIMPSDLINARMLINVIKEFFGTSQLSQFMDQTNPLSEITHKRRISALGPGGLVRDRAGFEVRGVHPTHYGRICCIETPEGQNIGLINSLASYAIINKHGFIESPYRKVKDGVITDEVVYLSAMKEWKYVIAQANARIDENRKFLDNLVSCRQQGEFVMAAPDQVHFIDVTPMQMVSIATSLIPFVENDDVTRALMGANMQRQAVPLITSSAPFVGTGIEAVVARDSGASIIANHDGVVDQVDSTRVVVRYDADENGAPGVDIYHLSKFQRSNYNTCINQKPLVRVGDAVKRNQVIVDGPSTDRGQLALGKNVLVAFMPWNGYNYEDSILISEKIVRLDVFTSIHIEELSVSARDTRLGPEEITRDIPNVGEESLRHLDETGIVRIGAEVKTGDILVGKVTPKSESPMTPEEKLLRAIFGEKAADVKDTSLHVPPGIQGTVVEVKVFSRRGIEKDQRAIALERYQIQKLIADKEDELNIVNGFVFSNLKQLLVGHKIKAAPKGIKKGAEEITAELLGSISRDQWWNFVIDNKAVSEKIAALKKKSESVIEEISIRYNDKIDKIQIGDDLQQGILKEVRVFIATKHKLQPGDKMAGRHGNKGVVSRIVPQEDLPYLEDGKTVDIVLNPVGVPSRMNIGQILETHLGWASVNLGIRIQEMLEDRTKKAEKSKSIRSLLLNIYTQGSMHQAVKDASDDEVLELAEKVSNGVYFATPVFDGAKIQDIDNMLELSGVGTSGQVKLIDGRTGESFDRDVTVGYIYMLKLHHLVDDKIHARSVGPYSLVTQQPLGGKSHFGGQRFGEMECWALQAYGAAYTLQEMLTVKSDDVVGRVKMFEAIVRGDNEFETGVPESFNVMLKELRSLCLNVELKNIG